MAGPPRDSLYLRPLDDKALPALGGRMQLQPHALEAEAQQGINALQSGDFTTARDAFGRLTASGSASPQAWLFYAQACDGCDDRDNALAALERVLADDKANPFPWLMKGDIFARNGDDRASVSFYRLGLRRAADLAQLPGDLPDRIRRAEDAVAAAEKKFEKQLEETLT